MGGRQIVVTHTNTRTHVWADVWADGWPVHAHVWPKIGLKKTQTKTSKGKTSKGKGKGKDSALACMHARIHTRTRTRMGTRIKHMGGRTTNKRAQTRAYGRTDIYVHALKLTTPLAFAQACFLLSIEWFSLRSRFSHAYTHAHTPTHSHAHSHAHTHTYTHICCFINACMHERIHTNTRTRASNIWAVGRMHTRRNVHRHVRMGNTHTYTHW